MLPLIRPFRHSAVGVAFACFACLAACTTSDDDAPVAHVETFAGTLKVHPNAVPQGETKPGKPNMSLFDNDVISTGPDSKATIAFAGGNKVEMEANASMVIHRKSSTLLGFSIEILAGVVHASGAGNNGGFQVKTRFVTVEFGPEATLLDINVERGLNVRVGEIQLVRGDKREAVKGGRTINLEGIVSDLSSPVETPKAPVQAARVIQTAPMMFILLAKPQQVMVMAAGTKAWKNATKRTTLQAGDRVKVKKGATGARVVFGDDGALALRADTDVAFTKAETAADSTQAGYALHGGSMQIALSNNSGKQVSHEVEVAGAKVKVQPTLREANVQVETTKTGAELTVRNGEAHINDVTIEAGSVAELANGKIVGSIHPLSSTKIDVRAHTSAIIYYEKKVPAINLWWSDTPTKPTTVEVANDREFSQLIAAERLTHGSFNMDQLAAGKYYWRLNQDNATRGSIQIMQESESDCANCKRTNVIDDTGEKTVVYFQQALPAITLRWKDVDGAASYTLKVFTDGEFDKPLIDAKVKETKHAFESGRFPEGKYYWLIAALDDKDRELSTGRMNSLQIAYDNAITALVIRAPKPNFTTGSPKLTTHGEAELGAKVFVNGHRIEVDDAGRFSELINLKAGLNQIVYKAAATDGIERYYLREVTRR